MKATLDSIKPLMSITTCGSCPINPIDENSDMKVNVEYGVGKKKKKFVSIVKKHEWNEFIKRYESCKKSFWEMGED